MQDSMIELNGIDHRLRVWDGPEGSTPLLLLHAGGENLEVWDACAEPWAARRTVYALDFRGHGQSGRANAYSLELMRSDVEALLDVLALGDVWVVGHSLGGMIGYLLAAAGRREVSRLVLEEAPPPLPLRPPRAIPEDPGGDFGFDWKFITDVYPQRNEPDPDWWPSLATITIPVLVIAGGESSHVDQAEMQRMANQIPTAELVELGGGHNVHADRPNEFLEAVNAFFDR